MEDVRGLACSKSESCVRNRTVKNEETLYNFGFYRSPTAQPERGLLQLNIEGRLAALGGLELDLVALAVLADVNNHWLLERLGQTGDLQLAVRARVRLKIQLLDAHHAVLHTGSYLSGVDRLGVSAGDGNERGARAEVGRDFRRFCGTLGGR